MAENIGTLFSEIIIDGRRFTAQLQAIGKEGEKAGKDLGESISKGANKATSSLEQMKAVAMQLAYRLAAVYSIHQISGFIKETALAAARFETLGVVMTQVAKISKVSTDVIKEQELALRKQGISMTETRSNLTKMMQAQIDTAKASKLARIAQDAAVIGDINSSEAFARMIHGIKSGQTEILRNIGLQVSNEAAYKNLAKSLKITTGQLTENQKMQARVNAVLEEGAKIVGVYEAAMSTAGKKLNSFTRYVQDFKVMMGEAFGPAMVIIIDSATESMKKLQKQISSPEAQQALKSLAIDFSKFIKIIIEKTPEAVLALTKLLAQIAKFYEASSGDALVYAGIGIVAFKLFGATPIGQFAAGVFLVAAAVSQLRFEIDKLFGGTKVDNKNFSNIMAVISGKRDWNTGESLISSASPGGLSSHESWRLGEGRYDSYDRNEMRRLGLIKPEIIKDKEKIELTKEQLKAIQAIESQYYSQAKFQDLNYFKWQMEIYEKEKKEHLEKGVSKLIADKIYYSNVKKLEDELWAWRQSKDPVKFQLATDEVNKAEQNVNDIIANKEREVTRLQQLMTFQEKTEKEISEAVLTERKKFVDESNTLWADFYQKRYEYQKKYRPDIDADAVHKKSMDELLKNSMLKSIEYSDQEYAAKASNYQKEKALHADKLNLYKKLYDNLDMFSEDFVENSIHLLELEKKELLKFVEKLAQTLALSAGEISKLKSLIDTSFETNVSKTKVGNLNAQISYYEQIKGYEDEVFQFKLDRIESIRKAESTSLEKSEAANKKAYQARIALYADEATKRINSMQSVFSGTASALESISRLYAEGSKERERYHKMAMAFETAERVAILAKAVVSAVAAVANAATNTRSWVEALVAIAAVGGALAGVFASAGVSFGGGSSHTASLSASTVLGAAPGTASESIDKSYELLKDTYDMQYDKLSGLLNEMKDLNENITGLVTNIVRKGLGLPEVWTGKVAAKNLPSAFSEKGAQAMFSTGLDPLSALGTMFSMNVTDAIFGKGTINKLHGKVFGGETKTSQISGGMGINSISAAELIGGESLTGYTYADMYQKKKGGWFSSDKKKYWTEYGNLDQSTSDLLTLVYKDISETLVQLSIGLGQDVTNAMNYVFSPARWNLQGMSTDQIDKTLKAYFSQIGDQAVETLFGTLLRGYQEVGEGLLETAIRIMIDKEVIIETLKMTNQAFIGTTEKIIAFSEALIDMAGSLEGLTEAAGRYYDKFFTDAEKHTRLQEQLTNAMNNTFLGINSSLHLVLPSTRIGYRAVVEALDLTTTSGMQAYITLLTLSEAADKYYTTLEGSMDDVIQKQKDYIQSLKDISKTIDEWLDNLRLSNLAPVQSEAEWMRQYIESKTKAQNPLATQEDVSSYLNFASKYLEFQKSFGTTGSYQAIYDAVVNDVTGIQTGKNALLEIAEQQLVQLETIALNTSDAGAATSIANIEQQKLLDIAARNLATELNAVAATLATFNTATNVSNTALNYFRSSIAETSKHPSYLETPENVDTNTPFSATGYTATAQSNLAYQNYLTTFNARQQSYQQLLNPQAPTSGDAEAIATIVAQQLEVANIARQTVAAAAAASITAVAQAREDRDAMTALLASLNMSLSVYNVWLSHGLTPVVPEPEPAVPDWWNFWLERSGGNAKGGVFGFANGDIFNDKTFFPMKNNQIGMLGEAGPEAIMPLGNDPFGRLGVNVYGDYPGVAPLKIGATGSLGIDLSDYDRIVSPFKQGAVFNSNSGTIKKNTEREGEAVIHNHIYLDGREIQYNVAKGMKNNPDLIQSVRKAVHQ